MNFDFLNKLTHEHEPAPSTQIHPQSPQPSINNSSSFPNQYQPPSQENGSLDLVILPPRKSKSPKKQQKKHKKIVSTTAKLQEGMRADLQPQVVAAFRGMLKNSEGGLSSILKKDLNIAKESLEKKVYIRQMSYNEGQYLQEANQAAMLKNNFVSQALSELTNGITDQIAWDIQSDKFEVRLKRKRFGDGDGVLNKEAMKLIRQQESQLHEKIGQLNVQLRETNILDQRARQIVQKTEFDPQNIKTKLAEQFVKNKQRQKQQKRAKQAEMKERKRQMELQIKQEKLLQEQQNKQERHLALMGQFLDKQKAKKQRSERQKVQKLNFQSFLKQYSTQKPLFKKKQQQFQENQKQQKIERFNKLRTNQAKYEPLNIEHLDGHEERYMELKQEDRQRKKAELNLVKNQENLRKKALNQKMYKGKFRYLLLQEMSDIQAKKKQRDQQRKYTLAKKQAYSLQVKQRYRPSIDMTKRQQIQQIISTHQGQKRKYMTPTRGAYSERYSTISRPAYSEPQIQPDPKRDGKRYHRLFKQYIRDKVDRGEVKSQIQMPKKVAPPKYDYLKEVREKYSDRAPSRVARLDRQIEQIKDSQDYRMLAIKAEDFERKVKQRQIKIKNVPHKPQDEARLEQDYLCAIKAKMELLSNID